MSSYLVTEVSWSSHKSRVERIKWAPIAAPVNGTVYDGELKVADVNEALSALARGHDVYAKRYVDDPQVTPTRLRRVVDKQGREVLESAEPAHPLTDLPEF